MEDVIIINNVNYVTNIESNNILYYCKYSDILAVLNKSYNGEQYILSQFRKDYDREIIFINNLYYKDSFKFLNYIRFLNKDIQNQIILLCCQSTLELPYTLLTNIYKLNQKQDMLLVSSKNEKTDAINIRIITNEKNVEIKLNKKLFLLNINENKYYKEFMITMHFIIPINPLDYDNICIIEIENLERCVF